MENEINFLTFSQLSLCKPGDLLMYFPSETVLLVTAVESYYLYVHDLELLVKGFIVSTRDNFKCMHTSKFTDRFCKQTPMIKIA